MNKTWLKQRAHEEFEPPLADAVAARIDAAVEPLAPAEAGHTPGPQPESIVTLFQGDRFYDELGTGSFSGLPTLMWNGMEEFIFTPSKDKPFSYVTSTGRRITPGFMSTDGGSIPRILRGLKKFSSWGYGPAFVIHDWLYTAKKCQYDQAMGFHETSMVMAEAMKTLMQVGFTNHAGKQIKLSKAEDTLYLMYQAVDSDVAKALWNDNSTVTCLMGPSGH